MALNAPIFTKLTITGWNFVGTYCVELHENPTSGSVGQTDWRDVDMRRSAAYITTKNWLIWVTISKTPPLTARLLCPLDALNETLTSTIPIRPLHDMLSHR